MKAKRAVIFRVAGISNNHNIVLNNSYSGMKNVADFNLQGKK